MARYQPALLGALLIGILSSLPVLSLANCCCLWVICGGVLTAYLQQQNLPTPLATSDAAVHGLMAGALGGLFFTIVQFFIMQATGPMILEQMRSQMSSAQMPPEMLASLLQTVRRRQQSGDQVGARVVLRALAAQQPDDPRIWLALATVVETRDEQRQALLERTSCRKRVVANCHDREKQQERRPPERDRQYAFDEPTWQTWVEARTARPLPGAVEFAQAAQADGVTIFYVTNRSLAAREATIDNLRAAGFPVADDASNVMTIDASRGWTSDKATRRSETTRLSPSKTT